MIITADTRSRRVRQPDGNWEWEDVPCFKFTDEGGRESWAMMLDDEQAEEYRRQEYARRALQMHTPLGASV